MNTNKFLELMTKGDPRPFLDYKARAPMKLLKGKGRNNWPHAFGS